jgi:hypothetical protein
MTLTEYAKTAGRYQSKYQVVITFNDERLPRQMDIFLASSQAEVKDKVAAAYSRYGIKSIHVELYRN